MRRLGKLFLTTAAIGAVILAVGGCPGGGVPAKPGIPDRPGGDGSVNPDACGAYSASEAGRKIKAFLEATVALDKAVKDTEATMLQACQASGAELGMTGLEGDTKEVCNKVFTELQNHMKAGLKAEATLDVQYEPAVCEVNVEAAASAAAKCEAKAEADIAVSCSGVCEGTCQGTCEGTCQGTCDGTCKGAAGSGGSGGQCDGVCEGNCNGQCSAGCTGTCTGECVGHADVNASAECEANAEVHANVDAECTEPKLEVTYDAAVVVDKAKLEAAVAAIKAGFPRMLMVGAKINGPVKAAFTTWSKTARDLGSASQDVAKAFEGQALCVAGQLSAAAAMIAQIEVSIEVQIEVSASAQGSVGGGA